MNENLLTGIPAAVPCWNSVQEKMPTFVAFATEMGKGGTERQAYLPVWVLPQQGQLTAAARSRIHFF